MRMTEVLLLHFEFRRWMHPTVSKGITQPKLLPYISTLLTFSCLVHQESTCYVSVKAETDETTIMGHTNAQHVVNHNTISCFVPTRRQRNQCSKAKVPILNRVGNRENRQVHHRDAQGKYRPIEPRVMHSNQEYLMEKSQ
jgi:hypothetical protein